MTVSKQKKLIFGIVYSMVLVFTLCFSGLVISSYIKEKQEFERFKQTWQYRADTNFTQSIKTDEETGEQVVVYNISTPEQLAGMFVHSEKVQADSATSHYVNGKYQLTQNLSLSGGWDSSNYRSFTGIFYGNGFVISGINSAFVNSLTGEVYDIVFEDVQISTNGNAGVVANSSSGTIKNVQVVSGTISGSSRVGGLVGTMSSGKIENCKNQASVSGGYNLGGIVGYAGGGTIKNCINFGSVSSSKSSSESCFGGIVGQNKGATITLCINRGYISLSSNMSYDAKVGGIAGSHTSGSLTKCANYDTVLGSNTSSGMVYSGGIAGYATSAIGTCYNGGTIFMTQSKPNTDSGTISIGLGEGKEYAKAGVNTLFMCDGTKVGEKNDSGTYKSTSYASKYETSSYGYCGGIVGYSTGWISSCYNKGTVSKGSATTTKLTLYFKTREKSWFTSDYSVLVTFTVEFQSEYRYGGICGNRKASVTDCYNNNSTSEQSKNLTIKVSYTSKGASTFSGTILSSWANSTANKYQVHTGYYTQVDASEIEYIDFYVNSVVNIYSYSTGIESSTYKPCGYSGTPKGFSSSVWTSDYTSFKDLYW